MEIEAVLFDADGVIQRLPATWMDALRGLAGSAHRLVDVEAFVADVFAAERPCLTGAADFRAALAGVLARWRSPAAVDDALALWDRIEVDADMMQLIARLRRHGVPCFLATNQHAYRAAYMSAHLEYCTHFDACFYSCDVGYTKPDSAYFAAVLQSIPHPPCHLLFIDDHEGNVAAARDIGLHAIHLERNAGVTALLQQLGRYDLLGDGSGKRSGIN
jgi:putative hydrolase of the HAD superfamily